MKKIFLSLVLAIVLLGQSLASGQIYHDFPPTSAFRTIGTQNGTIYAKNYYYPVNVTGSGIIHVNSSNKTHTVIISASPGTNQGTYNTTQANNVNINSGGYKINFINGSGSTINVKNSKSSTQVNITISSTGSGGTITGSGSANQMTYWTGTSAIAGATNMIWDNANNVLKGLSDVTTSLGTSSLRFLNIFSSVINSTNTYTNIINSSTGSKIIIGIPTSKLTISDFACGSPFVGLSDTQIFDCAHYALLLSPNGDTLINRPSGKGIDFREANQNQMIIAPGGNLQLVEKIGIYNNTGTVLGGVPAIVGDDNRAGLTTPDGSKITIFTTPAGSVSMYRLSVFITNTAYSSGTAHYTIFYTYNGAVVGMDSQAGSVNAVGQNSGIIKADPNTNIQVQLTGTFSATCSVLATVERIG